MTTASAPSKIILLGEHSALYGKPVLTMALGLRSYSRAEKRSGGDIMVNAPDFGIKGRRIDMKAVQEPALSLVARSLEIASRGSGLPGLEVTIRSDVPIASGMGSSASISASLIAATSSELGIALGRQELAEATREAENVIHTRSSGVDPFAVVFGGICLYQNAKVRRVEVPKPPELVIAHTGIESNTGGIVASVDELRSREPDSFESFLDSVEELVLDGARAMEAGDWQLLGSMMDRNHELLSSIGVSSPELDKLVDAARDAGALGAKLCGAGRGGIMISLADSRTREAVETALLGLDAKIIKASMDEGGTRIEDETEI